jgi:hypothetical protein
MELTTVTIEKPETINFILGQSHFIKSVEDLHEALVNAVPGIKFGLAFCEASGACLVRWSGNDEALIALATRNALAVAAGHSFLIFLADGFYPINVLTPSNRYRRSAVSSVPRPILRRLLSPKRPRAAPSSAWRMGPNRRAWKIRRASPGASSSCARLAISSHEVPG